jgi:hypothetical protein
MSAYHVSFFKTLLSSDGHPFKCLQQRIDISDAESSAQAVEAASRAFEAFYGCPWKLHADSIEVIACRPRWSALVEIELVKADQGSGAVSSASRTHSDPSRLNDAHSACRASEMELTECGMREIAAKCDAHHNPAG